METHTLLNTGTTQETKMDLLATCTLSGLTYFCLFLESLEPNQFEAEP
jgi:hypothetical protein